MGTPNAHSISYRMAAQATNVKWAPLPSVFVGEPAVRVRVGGVPVALPGTWEIVVGRSTTGVESIYGLDDQDFLHIVMLRADGEPAELIDAPDHVLGMIRDHYFPGGAS